MTRMQDSLRRYVPGGKPHKVLAAEWLEAWRSKTGRAELTHDGVESRLSEALGAKPPGLRFFFADPARAEVTMSVFQVPANEQPQLRRQVFACIGQGRLVLFNLIPAGREVPAALWSTITELHASARVSVVMTSRQYDDAPPSFRDSGVTIRRSEDASEEIKKALADGAVIASPTRVEPHERWVAFSAGPQLELDPPNAFELLASGADLDALPTVDRPLTEIAVPTNELSGHAASDFQGPTLRRLVRALAEGQVERVKEICWIQHASERAAVAQRLGVTAAATLEEWREARGIDRMGPSSLPESILMARYEPKPRLAQIGDKLYAFNPDSEMKERFTSKLFAGCAIESCTEHTDAKQLFEQVRAEVGKISNDDALADPLLFSVIEKMSRKDAGRAFEVACAIEYLDRLGGLPAPAPATTVDAWKPALKQLLGAVDPEARLQLRSQLGRQSDLNFIVPKSPQGIPPMTFPVADLRPRFDLIVSRGEDLVWRTVRRGYGWERETVNPGAWSASMASRIRSGNRAESKPEVKDLSIEATRWAEADDVLASAVIALRAAVGRDRSAQLPGSWSLIELSGGLFARVQVRKAGARKDRVRGCVLQHFGMERSSMGGEQLALGPLLRRYVTHEASCFGDVTQSGPVAPTLIHLWGKGLIAEISFGASSLLDAEPSAARHVGQSAAASRVRAQRQQDD